MSDEKPDETNVDNLTRDSSTAESTEGHTNALQLRLQESWEFASPWLRSALPVILFVVAAWLLHHEFTSIKAADVVVSLRSLPVSAILLAILLTACNYVVMIGYDWFGVRLVNHPLSLKQVSIASLLSYAFSNSLGFVFGGTPVRVRLYSAWGMSGAEIVRMLVFISMAFWMGLFSVAGVLFVATPFEIPSRFHLPLATSQPLGAIMLVLVAAFFVTCLVFRKPIHLFKVNIQPPPFSIGVAQVVISALDFLLASATLYVLLPADTTIGYFAFTSIFLLAIIVALASHVPGGLGVLELVLVTMLPQSSHGFVASLLVFRIIYYFLPLIAAVAAIGVSSIRHLSSRSRQTLDISTKHLQTLASSATGWAQIIGPRIITGAVFLAGLMLLISGSLPTADGRMEIVRRAMPLPVVEMSHFFGSIVGALLLILARGLQRRIDAAWGMTIVLLGFGVVFSIVKGFDYEEAIILSVLLVALLPCREHFYRRGSLFAPSWTWGWLGGVAMAIVLLVWLVLFAFRHVEYSNDLWWDFAYHGDAPRSLRALLGVVIALTLVAMTRLLRTHCEPPPIASAEELNEVAAIVAKAEPTNANLALLGDKRFVFSQDRKAFVMFGCSGNSWIAMGDPVGPDQSADDAAWKFREACDTVGVSPVFYQIAESSLGRYIDMGMSMRKLGEVARVPLPKFSLEGSSRKDLRRSKKKSGEAGLSFRIINKSEVAGWMPKLKEISDLWLGDKSAGEKGFSLGYFDETYLLNFDIAVVVQSKPVAERAKSLDESRSRSRQRLDEDQVNAPKSGDFGYGGDEDVIAFANMWRGANHHELSIDLMRYKPDALHGVMEYLFLELMLYGHEQGYQWFDIGMAPLSGASIHRLSPLWNRVSDFTFRHGERFYNFKGLRAYKEKFDPVWTPMYLASPGGISTARVLTDVTTLISGGVAKLLHR